MAGGGGSFPGALGQLRVRSTGERKARGGAIAQSRWEGAPRGGSGTCKSPGLCGARGVGSAWEEGRTRQVAGAGSLGRCTSPPGAWKVLVRAASEGPRVRFLSTFI